MENFLRSKEYWTLVEIGIVGPASEIVLTEAQRQTLEDQRLKDLKTELFVSSNRSCHSRNHSKEGHC